MQLLGQRSVALWTVIAGICAVVGVVFGAVQLLQPSPEPVSHRSSSVTSPTFVDDSPSPSDSPSPGPSPTPSSSPLPALVWSGTVTLRDFDSIDLRSDPPYVAHDADRYDLQYVADGRQLTTSADVFYGVWQDGHTPTSGECDQTIRDFRHGNRDVGTSADVRAGTRLCVWTRDDPSGPRRTAFVEVASAGPTAALHITLWAPKP